MNQDFPSLLKGFEKSTVEIKVSAKKFFLQNLQIIASSPKLTDAFYKNYLKEDSKKTALDVIFSEFNNEIVKLLKKLNESFDEFAVQEISYDLVAASFFQGRDKYVLGVEIFNVLTDVVKERKFNDLSQLDVNYLADVELLAGVKRGLEDYKERMSETLKKTVELNALKKINEFVASVDSAIEKSQKEFDRSESVPPLVEYLANRDTLDKENVNITKEAVVSLLSNENYLANSDIRYLSKILISGNRKIERTGFLDKNEQFREISYKIQSEHNIIDILAKDPEAGQTKISGTLYKAYFRSSKDTKYQSKEIFTENNLFAAERLDIEDFGFIEISPDALVEERDLPVIKLYYKKVVGLIEHMKKYDPDLVILNVSIYFIVRGENQKFFFQPLTIRADKFKSFTAFNSQLEKLVEKLPLEKEYYSEANITIDNLMLGQFAIHSSRKSYLGAGKHSTQIKKLYNIEEFDLVSNTCGFKMLNKALDMTEAEFNSRDLKDYEKVISFLVDREYRIINETYPDRKCFTECTGEYFDDETGDCYECSPKFILPEAENKIAVIRDAFLIDTSELTETVNTEKVENLKFKINKCKDCSIIVCNCRSGKCPKCYCVKCKRSVEGTVAVDKKVSYHTPQIKFNYLCGNENSKFKFVIIDSGKQLAPEETSLVKTYHVDRILDYKYPDDKLYIDKNELKLMSDHSIICKIDSTNAKAIDNGIGNKICHIDFNEKIAFYDFECVTIHDEFGIRQVAYSLSLLIITRSELAEIDADDLTGNVAKWHAKTQFYLEEKFCPEDFKKNPTNNIIVGDIGLILYNLLKNAALNRERLKLVSYNGTNYDNLILNELLTAIDDDCVDEVFWTGSKLNNMKIFKTHDMFDLCRHLPGGLANVCKSFKVKSVAKSSFDHKKANIAARKNKLFEFLSEGGLENIVNYNNLDVLSLAVILNRYNKEVVNIIDSAPEILKKLSGAFENDKTGLIGGVGDEKISFKRLFVKDIWNYPTIAGFIIYCLKSYWKNCGFVIENYNGKTIRKEYQSHGLKTQRNVNKKFRVTPEEDLQVYTGPRSCGVGGHVAQEYKSSEGGNRFCVAQYYEGKRASLDAASLYPTAAIIFPSYYPVGNRIVSKYIPGDSRIGFFHCKITQITPQNKVIYIPLKVTKHNAHLYEDGKKLVDSGNDWNYTGVIEDMCIDTDNIEYLRSKGCIVEVLDKDGVYFTGKIKNLYLFGFLLAVAKVKSDQDDYAASSDPIVREKINAVLRNTCKLILNSALGKLLQRIHTDKTKWVTFKEYNELIAVGRDPVMLTEFRNNGLVLVKYQITEQENMKATMPMHLGLFVYSVSKRCMHECIWDKLQDADGNSIQPNYVDTDSCHTDFETFQRWKKNIDENEIKVPHWPELEQILPAYATHKLYEENSKIIGSFDNELDPTKGMNREIILGNKMYLVYNKEKYDEKILSGEVTKGCNFLKLSSAGVNFGDYIIISDYAGLETYAYEKYHITDGKEIIRMVNDGEIPFSEVSGFVYKGDPRRAFIETLKYGHLVMIRQIFQRNIKESPTAGSSTISLKVDTKILKRVDFINSPQDLEMEEYIKDHSVFDFIRRDKKVWDDRIIDF